MTEASIIHPATQRWLEANGYEFQHEVAMPQHGRADFVATRGDETLVVECKQIASKEGARQALDYAQQTGFKPVLAAPADTFDAATVRLCVARGVQILKLKAEDLIHPRTWTEAPGADGVETYRLNGVLGEVISDELREMALNGINSGVNEALSYYAIRIAQEFPELAQDIPVTWATRAKADIYSRARKACAGSQE